MYPPLGQDHQVFGNDFCSGFVDKDGNWNNGFYCPPISPDTSAVYCCGDSVLKYCCTGQLSPIQGPSLPPLITNGGDMDQDLDISRDYDISSTTTRPSTIKIDGDFNSGGNRVPEIVVDIGRNSTVAAVICGLVAVTVLMTLVACFYCKCCLLYKKRRSQLQLPGGLYRIPASSANCGLLNSNSTNNATTPSSSSFNHSHNSAFVTTAIPILDPWGGPNGGVNPPPISVSQPQTLAQTSQGYHHHNYHNYPPPPTLLRNNVADHNQTQIINRILTPGRITRPTFPNSPESSSNSSVSTISSCTPNTRPHGNMHSGGNPISRTNSIPPTTTAAIALRLQRQLLQTYYQNHVQHQQNQHQNSNSLSRNSSTTNQNSNQHQQGYNYSRNGIRPIMTSATNQPQQIPTIYNVGRPTTMSSILSSVSFSPASNRSSSSNSLPPPYFLEQYRIRNRVRVPRNPLQMPSSNLPSYHDIQQLQENEMTTVQNSSHRNESTNRSQTRNDRHFPTSSLHRQPLTSCSSNTNNPRRPNHLLFKASNSAITSASIAPMSSTIAAIPSPSSPLNDLSAPPVRRPGRSCRSKGTHGTVGNNGPGLSPSRDISRQITETSNVPLPQVEHEYDPSVKILNTTSPASFQLQDSSLKSNSNIKKDSRVALPTENNRVVGGGKGCKSQSLENVNVASEVVVVQKNEDGNGTSGADVTLCVNLNQAETN